MGHARYLVLGGAASLLMAACATPKPRLPTPAPTQRTKAPTAKKRSKAPVLRSLANEIISIDGLQRIGIAQIRGFELERCRGANEWSLLFFAEAQEQKSACLITQDGARCVETQLRFTSDVVSAVCEGSARRTPPPPIARRLVSHVKHKLGHLSFGPSDASTDPRAMVLRHENNYLLIVWLDGRWHTSAQEFVVPLRGADTPVLERIENLGGKTAILLSRTNHGDEDQHLVSRTTRDILIGVDGDLVSVAVFEDLVVHDVATAVLSFRTQANGNLEVIAYRELHQAGKAGKHPAAVLQVDAAAKSAGLWRLDRDKLVRVATP